MSQTMRHRKWRWAAVATFIVAFLLIAAHAYLLNERPSGQANCPLCHWLQHLGQGVPLVIMAVGVILVARATPNPVPVFCQQAHGLPFSARSPPSV